MTRPRKKREPGEEAVCKCGAKLIFLTSPDGALMPCQKVTVVYTRRGNRVGKFDPSNFLEEPDYHINHYQTCPFASEFSRKRAKKDAEPRQLA